MSEESDDEYEEDYDDQNLINGMLTSGIPLHSSCLEALEIEYHDSPLYPPYDKPISAAALSSFPSLQRLKSFHLVNCNMRIFEHAFQARPVSVLCSSLESLKVCLVNDMKVLDRALSRLPTLFPGLGFLNLQQDEQQLLDVFGQSGNDSAAC